MIRTGEQYRDSIRDGREVYINGERVRDVTRHPMFKPLVDIRARIYDMQHDPATRDVMTFAHRRRGLRRRPQASLYPAGLVGEAPGHRRGLPRHRRRGDPRRRRDGGRDVVALRRAGRAQRGRSAVLQEHRQPHRQGDQARSLPCLGQHRSQGRPLEAPAGPGPRHAAACGEGDRRGHHRARRQVRDRRRLCQPGLHQAHHRQLGRREAFGIRGGLHLRSLRRRT